MRRVVHVTHFFKNLPVFDKADGLHYVFHVMHTLRDKRTDRGTDMTSLLCAHLMQCVQRTLNKWTS
jgi:hypothetical protein